MTCKVLLKHGKNGAIAVYVPNETILKEVAAKIKWSQYLFLYLVWEFSDTPSYTDCAVCMNGYIGLVILHVSHVDQSPFKIEDMYISVHFVAISFRERQSLLLWVVTFLQRVRKAKFLKFSGTNRYFSNEH
jgi:hypothetical protein